jgi:hypothetical protein
MSKPTKTQFQKQNDLKWNADKETWASFVREHAPKLWNEASPEYQAAKSALKNGLNTGRTKEIELRKKQYEEDKAKEIELLKKQNFPGKDNVGLMTRAKGLFGYDETETRLLTSIKEAFQKERELEENKEKAAKHKAENLKGVSVGLAAGAMAMQAGTAAADIVLSGGYSVRVDNINDPQFGSKARVSKFLNGTLVSQVTLNGQLIRTEKATDATKFGSYVPVAVESDNPYGDGSEVLLFLVDPLGNSTDPNGMKIALANYRTSTEAGVSETNGRFLNISSNARTMLQLNATTSIRGTNGAVDSAAPLVRLETFPNRTVVGTFLKGVRSGLEFVLYDPAMVFSSSSVAATGMSMISSTASAIALSSTAPNLGLTKSEAGSYDPLHPETAAEISTIAGIVAVALAAGTACAWCCYKKFNTRQENLDVSTDIEMGRPRPVISAAAATPTASAQSQGKA